MLKGFVSHYKRYRFVLMELVKKSIRLRYRRSYLGVFWTLLEPLLNMIVLAVIFGVLNKNKDYGMPFPVYILSGRLIYQYFNQATKESTRAIRKNAAIIRKVFVPKYLFPLSYIISNFVIFLISLIVLAVVALGMGVNFNFLILQAVIPLLNLFLLTMGAGMILSTIGVFFKDMEYLWNVFMTLIFYACAIFYSADQFAGSKLYYMFKLNPLYCIIHNFRQCIIGEVLNWNYVLYSFGFAIISIILGTLFFKKNQDRFIMHL